MQKFNYRKYAVAALSLIMVGTMAACSGASSTDEALSHPGSVIGTVQFDVNPSASSVTVTPVGSPWTGVGSKVPGDGAGNIPNVTITTSNVSYNAGSGLMDFYVKLTWSDPAFDLWNVRIQTNSTTNTNVVNLDDDRCAATPWGTCLGGANPPAITFVSDVVAEGPESKNVCSPTAVCSTQYRNTLNAGCGQISTHWRLSESGGAGYKFWADLYGDKAPIDPLLDPRYNEFTSTQWMVPKKLTYTTTLTPPEGANSNSMLPNEWFYVHIYEDNPGNNQAFQYYYTEMDGNATPALLAPQHIEDTGNVAAYADGTSSSANYWYVGKFNPYTIRFDNAVIEIPANDGGIAPTLPAAKFCTAKGTRLAILNDPNGTTDGWNSSTTNAANLYATSNNIGYIKCLAGVPSNLTSGPPSLFPNPCGNPANGKTCPAGSRDGFANLDIDFTYVPLHVKATAVAGQTSFILPAFDSNTIMTAYSTEGNAYANGGHWGQTVSRSPSWPNWCEQLPAGICWTTGQYNLSRSYICVM